MAVPAFRAAGAAVNSANNVTNPTTLANVTKNASTVNGDLMVLVTTCRSNTATVGTPTGWNLALNRASGTASGGRIYIFTRIADGGANDTPSVTWTGVATTTTGDSSSARIISYSGVTETAAGSEPTPTDAAATTNWTQPAHTTVGSQSLVIAVSLKISDTAQTATITNFTERVDQHTTTGTGHLAYVSEKIQATAGSTGTGTVTPSSTTSSRVLATSWGFRAAVTTVTLTPVTITHEAQQLSVTHFKPMSITPVTQANAAQLLGTNTPYGRSIAGAGGGYSNAYGVPNAVGGVWTPHTSDMTYIQYIRWPTGANNVMSHVLNAGFQVVMGWGILGTQRLYLSVASAGGAVNAKTTTLTAPYNEWIIVGWNRAAGTGTTARAHMWTRSGGWVHENLDVTQNNPDNGPIIGFFYHMSIFGGFGNSDTKLVGGWNRILSDTQIEELESPRDTNTWKNVTGGAPVMLLQPKGGNGTQAYFPDLSNNGADLGTTNSITLFDGPANWKDIVAISSWIETNAAQALDKDKSITLTPATVINVAQTLSFTGGAPPGIYVNITAVTETDSAQALDKDKYKTITNATEADTAQTLSKTKTIFKNITSVTQPTLALPLSYLPTASLHETFVSTPPSPLWNVDAGPGPYLTFDGTKNYTAATYYPTMYMSANSSSKYSLEGSYFIWKFAPSGFEVKPASTRVETEFAWYDFYTFNDVGFIINHANSDGTRRLYPRWGPLGYWNGSVWGNTGESTVMYDPAVMRYMRVRESSGTVYWDYSTDGTSWTNITSTAKTFSLKNLSYSEYTGVASGPSDATWHFKTESFNPVDITKSLTPAVETDVAQILSRSAPIIKSITSAIETDTAQIKTVTKTIFKSITSATQINASQALDKDKYKSITNATQLNTAQALDKDKFKSVTSTTQLNTAQALSFAKTIFKTITFATQPNTAQTLDKDKLKTLISTTQINTAQPLSKTKTIFKSIATATETDVAQVTRGSHFRVVLWGTETDTARALRVPRITAAIQINTAQPLTKSSSGGLTSTTETDAAQRLRWIDQQTITPATQANTAQALDKDKIKTVTFATQVNAAQALSVTKTIFKSLAPATQLNTAQALDRDKLKSIVSATQLNTAQTLTFVKTIRKTLTPATQIDVALAITTGAFKAINFAAEIDTARALRVPKVSPALQVNTAQPLTKSKSPARQAAIETDIAQALDRDKFKSVTTSTETDSAQALDRDKKKLVINAAEADTAQALSSIKTIFKTLTPVISAQTAQPLTVSHRRTLTTATQANSAQTLTFSKAITKTITAAIHTNVAQALIKVKYHTNVHALETDLARALRRPKLTVTTETDDALGLNYGTGNINKAINFAAHTNVAQALKITKSKLLNTASETDQAITFVHYKPKTIQAVLEADTAQPLNKIKRRGILFAIELTSVQSLIAKHAITISTAVQTDVANALTKRKSKTLISALEADQADDLNVGSIRLITPVITTDSARPLIKIKPIILIPGSELDIARQLVRTVRRSILPASETDLAVILGGVRLVFPSQKRSTLPYSRSPGTDNDTISKPKDNFPDTAVKLDILSRPRDTLAKTSRKDKIG